MPYKLRLFMKTGGCDAEGQLVGYTYASELIELSPHSPIFDLFPPGGGPNHRSSAKQLPEICGAEWVWSANDE